MAYSLKYNKLQIEPRAMFSLLLKKREKLLKDIKRLQAKGKDKELLKKEEILSGLDTELVRVRNRLMRGTN